MIRRTLLEWDHLPYGNGSDEIPVWAADRLAAMAAASPLAGRNEAGVLEHGRKSLRARGVVGIVAADGLALEILPKIDLPLEADGRSTGAIRRKLVNMLAVALDLRLETGAATGHDWQRDTLLEILIRIFSMKLATAVRHGMPRHYVAEEEDLAALRGRLDVNRQFTTLAATPQRLACRYDAFSHDIALNQIMKAAIRRLARAAAAPDNQRRLAELTLAYAEVADVPVRALSWNRLILNRTNERWHELVELARLLLGDRFQTSTLGEVRGFSLLFEMNVLFEAYVARVLSRGLAGSGLQVSSQGGRLYCLEDENQRRLFQTRPDILVRRDGNVCKIIDTKWKRIAERIDDPRRGVSQGDVYQMMAYGRLYHCPSLTLLYPHHDAISAQPGQLAAHRLLETDGDELNVVTIDLSRPSHELQVNLRELFGAAEMIATAL